MPDAAVIMGMINLAFIIGGGFFFTGRLTGRLDVQDTKITVIERDVRDTKGLLVTAAVDANRLNRVESDIHDLRRGVGFINDAGARSVTREY